ncbi:MAG: flavodoxin [Candidatus Fimisoma sp.]
MIALILSICLLLCFSACDRQPEDTTEKSQMHADVNQENILIAYFTWADNTVVGDEDDAIQSALSHYASVGDTADYGGTDAISSASILAPGNTAKMAEWIQEYVGGDLFSIVVSEPYPDNYDECLERAADEKAEKDLPELNDHVQNMDDYDVVFLGFPNWWSSVPMAVFSFIEEYDLSGKTIVPFCSHGTGGIAGSV